MVVVEDHDNNIRFCQIARLINILFTENVAKSITSLSIVQQSKHSMCKWALFVRLTL